MVQHAIDNDAEIREICISLYSGDVDIPVILIWSFGSVKDKMIFVNNETGKYYRKILIESYPNN